MVRLERKLLLEPHQTAILFLIVANNFVTDPHLRKVNFHPLTSFEPICYLVTAPTIIVVNNASPYRTLADLLDAARANPGKLSIASIGPGSPFQIGFEILKRAANVDMTFVPYPGNAPAVNALLGGHVTSMFGSYSNVAEHLKSGKLLASRRCHAGAKRPPTGRSDRRRIGLRGFRG